LGTVFGAGFGAGTFVVLDELFVVVLFVVFVDVVFVESSIAGFPELVVLGAGSAVGKGVTW